MIAEVFKREEVRKLVRIDFGLCESWNDNIADFKVCIL
jgi:hypothetical protein